MKKIMMWCWIALMGLFTASCSPDEVDELTAAGLPSVAGLNVEITVDQTTNYVTFRLLNEGVIPVWIFSESDMVTENPYQKRYRKAGTYTVDVKVMNNNGMSDAAQTYEFTLDNDYSANHPLYGSASKAWVIDASTAGHFGCGPDASNAAGWWSAAANEKAGTGLYENVLTFKNDGTYTFEVGELGSIFVNTGVTLIGADINPGDGNDFAYPWTDQSGNYSFDNTTLKFPQQHDPYTVVGYVPNDAYLTSEIVFQIVTMEENKLELAWVAPDNSIAWFFRYVPKDGAVVAEKDPLFGNGTKTWRVANHENGHLGCGENATNAAGWYSAAPDEKAAFGVYDDRVTFAEDGTFTYSPGEDGLSYVNWGCTLFNTTGATEDFDIPNETQVSSYSVDDDYTTLTLAPNTFMPYIGNDQMYQDPVYTIRELTSEKLVLAHYNGSIAWQIILVPEDFTTEPGPEPFDPGAQIEPGEYKEMLEGTWTWENTSNGHMGCGETIGNPCGWWSAAADNKAGCSMYDDQMTFAADGTYTFDPVDGMTYMNGGVTAYTGTVVDQPLGDDYRVEASVESSTWTYNASGDFPSFTLGDQVLFSYIPNDMFFSTDRTFYITAMWENQIEISWYTATGNGGDPIAWRYRLMRVQ